jgi:hypothetical protein
MEPIFSKNGLVVVGFSKRGNWEFVHQGTLKACHIRKGEKFYRFIPSTQEKYWVYIADEIVEPIYGCTVVDYYKDDCDIDTPVYLVYLSEVALIKKYTTTSEESYWIFTNGWFTPVCKEWLMYYGFIPGVVEKTVVEPSQTPENIKERFITFLDD